MPFSNFVDISFRRVKEVHDTKTRKYDEKRRHTGFFGLVWFPPSYQVVCILVEIISDKINLFSLSTHYHGIFQFSYHRFVPI